MQCNNAAAAEEGEQEQQQQGAAAGTVTAAMLVKAGMYRNLLGSESGDQQNKLSVFQAEYDQLLNVVGCCSVFMW